MKGDITLKKQSNVKVPEIGEHTIKHAKETLNNIVKSPTEPLFQFLEENEEVFNGDLNYKINKFSIFYSNFLLRRHYYSMYVIFHSHATCTHL